MQTTKPQLSPLTGIRFFLATWVVIFHKPFLDGYDFKSHLSTPVGSILDSGYMAVGIFFLLSGFVLSYNYGLENRWSAGEIGKFGLARFARIYPAYALALLMCLPLVFAALWRGHEGLSMRLEAIKAGMVWTLTQAWVPSAADAWNVPAWSLSNEAFFYCLFPVVGVALWKTRTLPGVLAFALAVWAAALVAPAVAVIVPFRDGVGAPAWVWDADSSGAWVKFLKFFPLFHVPEFCMGILTGRVYRMLRDRNSRVVGRGYWLYLPALAVEAVAIMKWQPTLFPFLHGGLLLPVHALVILGFAFGGGWLAKALATRPLVLLGNASYSIYIFQSPIGSWIATIAKHGFSSQLWGWGPALLDLVVLTGFSIAVFIFVEEPANRMLKKKVGPLLGISPRKGGGPERPDRKAALVPAPAELQP